MGLVLTYVPHVTVERAGVRRAGHGPAASPQTRGAVVRGGRARWRYRGKESEPDRGASANS